MMAIGATRNLRVGIRLVVTALLMSAGACGRGGAVEDDPAAKAARTARQLANATYSGIMSEPVTLRNGRWEGEAYVEDGASRPAVGLVEHLVLTGDLDNDGTDEVAALLWESSGGSGTRLYLAAMEVRNGDISNLATTLIGDRVQVRSGGVQDGLITLGVIRAGPEDAACCPSEKAVVAWALNEGSLALVGDETTGTLSLADLEGPEWLLVEFGWGQPLPDDAGITLVFENARASGHSGCNTYFAGTVASAPGELGFNGMGATRMACPEPVMDLERRYLKTLAGASRYSFLAGHLVISCTTDGEPQALVFAPPGDPWRESERDTNPSQRDPAEDPP